MKVVKNIFKIGIVVALVWGTWACNKFDLDINDDPNNPTATTPNLLLTNIQYNLMDQLAGSGVNDTQLGFMGMMTFFDDFNVPATSWNGFWNGMYATVLKDVEGLIAASVEDPGSGRAENPHYLGIAQLLKAYSYMTMVDLFGDVPFTEAARGDDATAIKNPNFDKDDAVYRECRQLIENAITNLNKASGVKVDGDVIYAGNITRWKAFAQSLKLKAIMTTRLVEPGTAKTEIETFFAAGAPALITDVAGDFQFQFSKLITPDNRHPWYIGPYTGGEFSYISHQLMVEMVEEGDPRFPFYFKRQTKTVLDANNPTQKGTIPCISIAGCEYGYLVTNQAIIDRLFTNKGKAFGTAEKEFLAGLFGRDRADPSGVPADGTLRTACGVYPAGGFYDIPSASSLVTQANKAPGGGIFPALTHVNILYYRIEAALAMGASVGSDPRTLFDQAIRKHIDKVQKFGVATDGANAVVPSADTINKYVNLWLARYDAAPSDNAKLNVVLKQLWFASWGSGFESWNAFRRTGLPNTLQIPLNPVRDEPKRLPYPQNELTLNPNAAAYKDVVYDRDPIFWDKN